MPRTQQKTSHKSTLHILTLKRKIGMEDLEAILKKILFRGLYDEKGKNVQPYKRARFRLTTVYPPRTLWSAPKIDLGNGRAPLFSPPPTVYQNQIEIVETVDRFLRREKMRVHTLQHAVEYDWEGRGIFHVLPPLVEKHSYDLKEGFFDLAKMSRRFKSLHVKDARGNLHDLSKRYLNSFFIDEVSKIDHLDIFNSNAPLINYGLQYSGVHDFYIVCDGTHRIDYAIETLGKPITVILVEPETRLVPYYAFPVPFRPTIRLSSKRSEKMYPRLERDKIHLFNDFISKVLHYDWSEGGLSVSKLRSNVEVY